MITSLTTTITTSLHTSTIAAFTLPYFVPASVLAVVVACMPPASESALFQVLLLTVGTTSILQTIVFESVPATSIVEPPPAHAVESRLPSARRPFPTFVPAVVTDAHSFLSGPLKSSVAPRHPAAPPVASVPAVLILFANLLPAAYNPFSIHRSRRQY